MMARAYLTSFTLQWKIGLRYRIAVLAGLVAQMWFGAVTLMAYAAVYHHAPDVQAPLTLRQAMTYTWIQQSLFTLLPLGCLPAIGEAARTGAIVYDLLRPVDLWNWWLSSSLARLLGNAVPRAILLACVAGPLAALVGLKDWSLAPPASALAALFALLSFALGALLSATIMMWWNVLTARTLSPLGSYAIATPLSVLLSGMLLPLPLYPGWASIALLVQPFAGIADIPIRIYLGAAIPGGIGTALGLQLCWLAILTVLGRRWLSRIVERMEVQGA
ncbi:ABC transporter permease [Neoasaia chiangmaiensis NBRC 101099]|uniref:ABC transporter permease n=1 Tax=Neoasaia chiangmaiensis TaxID=320497 RepID=A0A1U9KRP7_9PROT|nr:ABC-2 family transporter protein [Neoasaia chiangmaiensis]AQS88412.1 ABC transporter permease [Neoasaia chiangmaiensis]GBR39310.1 ABC transporter permease [Neoasaia chiangmaiensis NBRC 101099]GEN14518.1 ABC transporter permease [Neoasaia chiangmaiensis]